MTTREAEETLGVIRTLMERSTHYRNLSGNAGIAAGTAALVGGALRHWAHTPFYPTWMAVLLFACGASLYFTGEMARAGGEPVWSRQAQTIVAALLPAFVAAGVLTVILERTGLRALLPGVWMLLWGVAALAMSFFTPRVVGLLGGAFLVAGSLTLLAGSGTWSDAACMAATFGLMHLAYGFVLIVLRPRRAMMDKGSSNDRSRAF